MWLSDLSTALHCPNANDGFRALSAFVAAHNNPRQTLLRHTKRPQSEQWQLFGWGLSRPAPLYYRKKEELVGFLLATAKVFRFEVGQSNETR
jgi:hypothetical protein